MPKIAFFLLIALGLTTAVLAQTKNFYVLAPSGLNLRKAADAAAEKITLLPFGAKVTLQAPATQKNLNVDQLNGGMAKLTFEGKTGFAFDGYLSSFPPAPRAVNSGADPEYSMEAYVELLRSSEAPDLLFETHHKDYGGYLNHTETIHLPTTNWQEVFLLAKQLLNIPPKFLFPKPSKVAETTLPNPDKKAEAWTDELQVKRDKLGQLLSIVYTYRTEAFGWSVAIERSKEQNNALLIAYTTIAD